LDRPDLGPYEVPHPLQLFLELRLRRKVPGHVPQLLACTCYLLEFSSLSPFGPLAVKPDATPHPLLTARLTDLRPDQGVPWCAGDRIRVGRHQRAAGALARGRLAAGAHARRRRRAARAPAPVG